MVDRSRWSSTPIIMLVDDQQLSIDLLDQQIGHMGYQVIATQHGTQALQLLEEYQPDAVLVDIFMPHMDGFEVLRTIRQHPLVSYTPVLMITAEQDISARQKAYLEGADDFLLKPVDYDTLRARLRVAVHLKRTLSRVEKERERFAFIAAMSRELGQIGSLQAMLKYVVDVCTQTLHADNGNLIVVQTDETHAPTVVTNTQLKSSDIQKVIERGAAGHVIRTATPARIDDVTLDPRWLPLDTSVIQAGSALLVPLGDSEGVLGVIAVYHSSICFFTQDDQDLLELVARQITGILRQAKLRDEQIAMTEKLSLQARQLRLVNSLAQTLSANIDLPQLYETIHQQMQLLLGDVDTCWYTFNHQTIKMAYSSLDDECGCLLDQPASQTLLEVRTQDQSMRIHEHNPLALAFQNHAFTDLYVLPLKHHGTTLGVLLLGLRERTLTAEDTSLLEMARPHLAVAMATAQTIADREARQTEQAELAHLRHMAELAGQMAHHFNNLFAVILGNTQLAELDAVNEEQQALLATVVDQIRDGAAMISRLYLLKGHKRISPPFPLDLAEAVPLVLEHIEQVLEIDPITRINIPDATLVPVQERELSTLCREIISNALESGSSVEQLEISTFTSDAYIYVYLKDRGQGIDPQQLSHVWRPFWTTHGPQRLGLGLPICSAIMWRLGGRITITNNEDGPGATTTLLFPHPSGAAHD